MLKPDGSHVFCETYEEHLENIRTFRAYQKERQKEKEKLEQERIEKEKALDNNETNKTK